MTELQKDEAHLNDLVRLAAAPLTLTSTHAAIQNVNANADACVGASKPNVMH